MCRLVTRFTFCTPDTGHEPAVVRRRESSCRRVRGRTPLPAVAPVIAVSVVLTASRAVLTEASLSFLGLGDPDSWSWGTILHNAQRSGSLAIAWWTTLFPSLAILLLVVSATLASFAYNDARNPRIAHGD